MIEESAFVTDSVYYGVVLYKDMFPVTFCVTYVAYKNQDTFRDMVKFKVNDWGHDEIKKSKTKRAEIEELIKLEINDRWKEATFVMS